MKISTNLQVQHGNYRREKKCPCSPLGFFNSPLIFTELAAVRIAGVGVHPGGLAFEVMVQLRHSSKECERALPHSLIVVASKRVLHLKAESASMQ